MRRLNLYKNIFCISLLGVATQAWALYSDEIDLRTCHQLPYESCDTRCSAGCQRVLMDDPTDTMAYYKLAINALNLASQPFMPDVDTNLRICSAIGVDGSALCEDLYAAITLSPHLFNIANRPSNPESALAWAEMAARRDDPEAKWILATFLASGAGLKEPNLVRAYNLMNKSFNVKPEREFAILHAMLLQHGWGGPENVLEADYYSKVGYAWLNSGLRVVSRTDNVFLDLIVQTAYQLGDGRLIHETAWYSTIKHNHLSDRSYSSEELDELLHNEETDHNVIADFYSRELLAANLGCSEAQDRLMEIEELLYLYEANDILDSGKVSADEMKREIDNNLKIISLSEDVSVTKKRITRSKYRHKNGFLKTLISFTSHHFNAFNESVKGMLR